MFSGLAPNLRGMLAMTASSFIFVISDTLVKLVTQVWPVSQLMAVRGVFLILIALGAVVATGHASKIGLLLRPILITRNIAETTVAVCFISALSRMPLADLTTMLMLSPLIITAILTLFFGEVVGWRRWGAILTGFAGLILVIQPGGNAVHGPDYGTAILLALASVFAVACRDILTRKLSDEIPSVIVMLGTAIGSCFAGLLLTPFIPWATFDTSAFCVLVVAAFIVSAGNFLLIMACRGVDLSVVAPYRYSAVIWAILIGILVFNDHPNWLSLCGMAVIVASGLYTMHRERVRRLKAEQASISEKP